jgi:hypothetical protein
MADFPDPGRSLREVFESLAGDPGADPAAALAASGHEGLPAHLLTEAIVSYADTAPPEVGEHLAPVILGAAEDPGLGLELLTSAPPVTWDDVPVDEFAVSDDVEPLAADDVPADDLPDLHFGAGDDAADLDSPDGHDVPDHDAVDDATDDGIDAIDDVPAVEVHHDEVADLHVPADDLPDHDLAGEGWDDASWDGDDGGDDSAADDLLDS